MTPISDRLSVVRPQWEAQLDAFHALTSRAIDSAGQLMALNLKTSRASVEQATGTLQQMLHVSDPRELSAIVSQAQGQWQQVFSYSRELMGIAMGARQRGWTTLPAQPVLQLLPSPAARLVEQAGIALADATTVGREIAAATADSGADADADAALAEDTLGLGDQSGTTPDSGGGLPPAGQIEPGSATSSVTDAVTKKVTGAATGTETDAPTELDAETTGEAPSEQPDSAAVTPPPPLGAQAAGSDRETGASADALADLVIADDLPPAKAKPLVEAMNGIAPMPLGAEHPVSATMPLAAGHVDLPLVTPAETTPPVQLSAGPSASERRRGSRKKS